MNAPIPQPVTKALYEQRIDLYSLALHATEHLDALANLSGCTQERRLSGEEWMFLLSPVVDQLRLLTAMLEHDAQHSMLTARKV